MCNGTIQGIKRYLDANENNKDDRVKFQQDKYDKLVNHVNETEKKRNNEKTILTAIVDKMQELYEEMKQIREVNDYNSARSYFEFVKVDDLDQFAKETGCNTLIKLSKSQISSKTRNGGDLP